VLSHQGGFVNWRSMNPGGKLAFDTVPGTAFRYSGEGFEYLRRAIEYKFHQSFDTLVNTYLFKPLRMKHSYLSWNANIDTLKYAGRFDQNGNKYPIEKNTAVNSAASLITTVEDYTIFALACLNATGLSKDVDKQMKTPQIMVTQAEHVGIGFAWVIVNHLNKGEFALMHSGSDPGIKTLIVLLPKSKRGVVIFTNGDNGKMVYEEILREMLDVGDEILSRMKK
jgi:CubicO group peptidase (beta-lactamase class C family)